MQRHERQEATRNPQGEGYEKFDRREYLARRAKAASQENRDGMRNEMQELLSWLAALRAGLKAITKKNGPVFSRDGRPARGVFPRCRCGLVTSDRRERARMRGGEPGKREPEAVAELSGPGSGCNRDSVAGLRERRPVKIFKIFSRFIRKTRKKLGMKILNILHCFETVPPTLDFVLPGMLHGTVGALISPGGAGKSLTALQIAIQITSGFDSLGWGRDLRRGPVVYLAAEDPEAALHFRLHEMGKQLNSCARGAVCDQLTIHPLAGETESINLLDPPTEHGLLDIAKGSRLLILDTLRRFHVGNENDSGDMAKVVASLEHIAAVAGTSILFLHHANKSSALGGNVDEQQSSRGSSVLVDNVRWQGFLSGMSKSEASQFGIKPDRRRFYVRFGVSKQNYGMPFEDVWFERGAGGILRVAKFEKPACSQNSEKPNRRHRDGH